MSGRMSNYDVRILLLLWLIYVIVFIILFFAYKANSEDLNNNNEDEVIYVPSLNYFNDQSLQDYVERFTELSELSAWAISNIDDDIEYLGPSGFFRIEMATQEDSVTVEVNREDMKIVLPRDTRWECTFK